MLFYKHLISIITKTIKYNLGQGVLPQICAHGAHTFFGFCVFTDDYTYTR